MKFTGKGSIFNAKGDFTQEAKADDIIKRQKSLERWLLKAVLKGVGMRFTIGEEALASVARGKGITVMVQEGEDQNYLIIALEDVV